MKREDIDAIRADVGWFMSLLKDCGTQQFGEGYRAKCPVHGGERLSMSVFRDRFGSWRWHCFVCDDGGDVFKLVMLLDGCDFPSSLRKLGSGGVTVAQYKWSPSKVKKGTPRTTVEAAAPCSHPNCREVLRFRLDELPVLEISHPSWDIERHGVFHVWVRCPMHHRERQVA